MAVPLLKAVALALRKFPELNGHHRRRRVRCRGRASISGSRSRFARVGSSRRRSATPTRWRLDELMRRLADLVARARALTLRSSEMTDATITVTNLGEQGVELVQGIIYPPQVALVGFGRVDRAPVGRRRARDRRTGRHREPRGRPSGERRPPRRAVPQRDLDRLLQEPEQLDGVADDCPRIPPARPADAGRKAR